MCEIVEGHCCKDCQHHLAVPVDHEYKKWELCCLLKQAEVNSTGGVSYCDKFEEKIV